MRSAAQRGMTLVELVIAIVIVGIAAAALFTAMAAITARSADPLLRQQSLAIAESYLEEISLRDFPVSTTCGGPNNGAGRDNFQNLCEYHGLFYDSQPFAPRSALSVTPLAGLEAYRVEVSVAAHALHDIGAADAVRIQISVTDPAGHNLTLAGYRARYP